MLNGLLHSPKKRLRVGSLASLRSFASSVSGFPGRDCLFLPFVLGVAFFVLGVIAFSGAAASTTASRTFVAAVVVGTGTVFELWLGSHSRTFVRSSVLLRTPILCNSMRFPSTSWDLSWDLNNGFLTGFGGVKTDIVRCECRTGLMVSWRPQFSWWASISNGFSSPRLSPRGVARSKHVFRLAIVCNRTCIILRNYANRADVAEKNMFN